MKKITLFLALMFIVCNVSATIWYVKSGENPDAWSNKPQSNVKSTFADAFNAALANDEIWLSSGTYVVDAEISFNKHLKVYGGFLGNENSINERVNVSNGKVWEFVNITVIEPNASYNGSFMGVPSGYNILINGITFKGFKHIACKIRQNTTIEQCVFTENSNTTIDGACVTMYPGGHVKNSYFYKNKAKTSTGIFANVLKQNASISGCTFEENEATWGTAINFKYSGGQELGFSYIVKDNVVINNKATTSGVNSIVNIHAEECVVSNMLIANNEGLPLYITSGTFCNGTIVNNKVKDEAVLVESAAGVITPNISTKIYNTLIWNNEGSTSLVAGIKVRTTTTYADFKNNAVDIATTGAGATATEENGMLLERENTGTEAGKNYAAFVSPATFVGVTDTEQSVLRAANWKLQVASSLVDKGNSLLVSGAIEYDLAGDNRFDGTVDIGAYEFNKSTTALNALDAERGKFNYANGVLFLKEISSGIPLSIINLAGAVVKHEITAPQIPLSLSKGIYFLRIKGNAYKFIVD